MSGRNFSSQAAPVIGTVPGYPAPDADSDWYARERAFVELVSRYARLGTWLLALTGALLFFAAAASVASVEFGIVPPAHTGGEELFSRGSADSGGAPNIWP